MSPTHLSTSSFNTSDGVTIRYIVGGVTDGRTLVFIPGWAQTAIQWHKQISYFGSGYRVLAIDHRGQGDSGQPSSGYRISRLAADLHEFILHLDLEDVVLIGHSMGCSVIWAFWNTFFASRARVTKLVLVDQSPAMVENLAWEDGLAKSLGSPFSPIAAYEVAASLVQPGGIEAATALLRSLFSPDISEDDFQWTLSHTSKMSMNNASTLFINHAFQDWTDVLPTITIPTLVIGAEKSLFTPEASLYISRQILGATVKIFRENEGGSHFMFWENAEVFNETVHQFIQD